MNVTFVTILNFGCLGEHPVEVKGGFTKGSPAVMYLRNGDPGYPAEPPEFEGQSMKILMDPELCSQYHPPLPSKLELPRELCALLTEEVFEKLNELGIKMGEEQYEGTREMRGYP